MFQGHTSETQRSDQCINVCVCVCVCVCLCVWMRGMLHACNGREMETETVWSQKAMPLQQCQDYGQPSTEFFFFSLCIWVCVCLCVCVCVCTHVFRGRLPRKTVITRMVRHTQIWTNAQPCVVSVQSLIIAVINISKHIEIKINIVLHGSGITNHFILY